MARPRPPRAAQGRAQPRAAEGLDLMARPSRAAVTSGRSRLTARLGGGLTARLGGGLTAHGPCLTRAVVVCIVAASNRGLRNGGCVSERLEARFKARRAADGGADPRGALSALTGRVRPLGFLDRRDPVRAAMFRAAPPGPSALTDPVAGCEGCGAPVVGGRRCRDCRAALDHPVVAALDGRRARYGGGPGPGRGPSVTGPERTAAEVPPAAGDRELARLGLVRACALSRGQLRVLADAFSAAARAGLDPAEVANRAAVALDDVVDLTRAADGALGDRSGAGWRPARPPVGGRAEGRGEGR